MPTTDKKLYFLTIQYFNSFVPVAQQARQAVVLGSLSLTETVKTLIWEFPVLRGAVWGSSTYVYIFVIVPSKPYVQSVLDVRKIKEVQDYQRHFCILKKLLFASLLHFTAKINLYITKHPGGKKWPLQGSMSMKDIFQTFNFARSKKPLQLLQIQIPKAFEKYHL